MGTSSSTSAPRSSPAAISPRQSPARSDGTSRSKRGSARVCDDVVVRVGIGSGRKVRFTGALVGEWLDSRSKTADHYRVWRGRAGKYVVHVERNADWWSVDSEGKPVVGWRGWMGIGDVRFGSSPQESTLEVVATLDELLLVPTELFDMVSRAARLPTVEELDI